MNSHTPQKSQESKDSDESLSSKTRAATNMPGASPTAGGTPPGHANYSSTPPQHQPRDSPPSRSSPFPRKYPIPPQDSSAAHYGQGYNPHPSQSYPQGLANPLSGAPQLPQETRSYQASSPPSTVPVSHSTETQAPSPAAPPRGAPFVFNKTATLFSPGKKKHPDFLRKHLEAEGCLGPGKDKAKPEMYRSGLKGKQLRREKKERKQDDKEDQDNKQDEQDDDSSKD
ncbi:hypothetical protein N0V83_005259 [Neocucurbitaria cava]|uniref:Uncharacterized protein n=1 Tax=Neocucurbitaria cava TaxID=798079 RepID=A0A9W9CMR6_9PLEO|nr:hypothetical protein N0V83_005259 [Neocucurbitaria cava]